MRAISPVFMLRSVQAAMGELDSWWHHLLQGRLPHRPSARYELVLHAVVAVPHGWVSWLFTAFALGVWAWSVRNLRAVFRLRRAAAVTPAAQPQAMPGDSQHHTAPATLVTGATGFVGRALVAQLLQGGQRVIVLTRDVLQARASLGPGVWAVDSLDAIPPETRIDAVVQLAGARVLGMPWTAARRRVLLASRVDTTMAVVALMRRLHHRPQVLVSASAVGFYGASPNASMEPLDENAPPRPGEFQSDLCAAIEHEARRAEALGVRVVRLRLGVVLGNGGGAYPMQALSARLGLGAVLGHGRQAAPWIHLTDAVGLIRFALARSDVQGPINAVAPDGVSQRSFVQALAASFGRRVWLAMPAAPLRWAMGEMSTLLLDGQNVVPQAALALGYSFVHPNLPGALRDLAAQGESSGAT
ncbi:MAG: TIGR01777 family oxidoreductase [Acidovorax sp.]|uniref:TIGR01777 family oxidoreductase n=1 Tax=Acidovorax sp. TaxID=1872122 RepID=UPI002603B80F|nr:TIGR01777 family oxidoreductase [Acidovorax sp.]MDH4417185.1 TIGR01777 family oxidoreductase [Acidovorax sp.]